MKAQKLPLVEKVQVRVHCITVNIEYTHNDDYDDDNGNVF